MLLKFLADKNPDYVAMAIDGPAKNLKRRELFADYKITRKPTPEDFFPQEKRIMQIVRAMGISVIALPGYEADDIMATIAERFATPDMKVVLISRDKDLDQLVCENVVLYDPMKDETFDPAAIEAKKGYPPSKAVEVQTLMGDTIDNIPGVPGVGPKTAVKLILKYGSADGVIAHADEQTPKLKENLKAAADTIDMSRQLVTLGRDIPLELSLDDLTKKPADPDISKIFKELDFQRLVDKFSKTPKAAAPAPKKAAKQPHDDSPLFAAMMPTASESASEKSAAAKDDAPPTTGDTAASDNDEDNGEDNLSIAADFDYQLIDTPEALAELAGKLKNVTRLSFDTETTSVRAMNCDLVGISLSWEVGRGYYIPVRAPLTATTLDIDAVRNAVGAALADLKIEKIAHNLKYDEIVLTNNGFEIAGPIFDTMIAAHVLDSTRMTYKMDALAADLLGHRCIPISDLIGTGKKQTTMDTVPTDIVTVYAAEDAEVTFRLAEKLRPMLAAENLDSLFNDLEMPLLPVLTDMERTGIRVDPQMLKTMEVQLSKQADALREQIIDAAGRQFNVDSPRQLAVILFDEMDLPVVKKTKTGPSTDSGVLEELASTCSEQTNLPELVLDYRKLTKLISTYLKRLTECINPQTNRVHTSFHQASVATGRLSSSDPNLQNIPIRTEQGRLIRSAFVADDGCVLLAADYSQVELRMLAHFCQDPTLLQAFADDQDIHRIVAAEVFSKSPDDITSDERGVAKTVNFGIIYGQTAFGLAKTLRIPRGEAGDFIKRYKQRFPKIDEFLQQCIEEAKANGYVETIFHRRRKIPEIDAPNPQRRNAAERLAINSVVQGSAADLIKQAMINIAKIIRDNPAQNPAKMLLQIHDELVFEVPQDSVEQQREMITAEMTSAIKLSVPLKVDVGVGQNWMLAK